MKCDNNDRNIVFQLNNYFFFAEKWKYKTDEWWCAFLYDNNKCIELRLRRVFLCGK